MAEEVLEEIKEEPKKLDLPTNVHTLIKMGLTLINEAIKHEGYVLTKVDISELKKAGLDENS